MTAILYIENLPSGTVQVRTSESPIQSGRGEDLGEALKELLSQEFDYEFIDLRKVAEPEPLALAVSS